MSFVYAGHYSPETLLNGAVVLLPGRFVSVKAAGSSTPATLYTNRTKMATSANPVLTDGLGNLSFYADPGEYDLRLMSGVIEGDPIRVSVPIDPAEVDSDFTVASIAARNALTTMVANSYCWVTNIDRVYRYDGAAWKPVTDVDYINVVDYGATGDGSTDDTAAIQAAINVVVTAGGGTVVFPLGVYKTTSTLTISGVRGVRLLGVSKYGTRIVPTSAIGTNPTVKFIDHRDSVIELMAIEGAGSTTTACVESHRSAASPPFNCRGMVLRSVRLGSNAASNMQVGFLTTAAGGADTNNDYHHLDDVEVGNATVAAFSFEHYNSLHHTIVAPKITNCPIGFRNTAAGGGTWSLHGGEFEDISDVVFDLNGTVDTTHPFVMVGFTTEGCARLLRADNSGGAHVLMTAFGMYGASTGVDVISWAPGATGTFVMDDAWILTGQPATTLRFSDTAGSARVSNCILGITDIVFNGDLEWHGNKPRSSQTFTAGASSTLHAGGDASGPYKFGQFTRSTAIADFFLGTGISGEAVDRFQVNHRGDMTWGPGSGATDTEVRRGGAGFLAVPMKVKAGVPADTDFLSAPPDGTLAINSSTNKMYCRIAGAWVQVS